MSVCRNKRGAEYYYYRCDLSSKVAGKNCNYFKHLRQDDIDSQVFQAVSLMVDYEQFADEVHAKLKQETDIEQLEAQIETAKKVLKSTRNNKQKLEIDMDNLSYDVPHYKKKREDLERRLDALYDREEEQEELVSGLESKYANIKGNKIKEDIVYDTLRNFTSLYEKFSDEEKKRFYNFLIEKIELYEEPLENGQRIKSITFKFPLMNDTDYMKTENDSLDIQIEVPRLDMKPFKNVTNKQIIAYVKEKYGVNIYKSYITDIKRKYGVEMRQYVKNPSNRRYCSKKAEPCIVEALKHFGFL